MRGNRLLRSLSVLTVAVGFALIPPIPSAQSQPPGFPDLGTFTEAPAGVDFSHPEKSADGYAFFRTPDGLHCMVGSLVRCSGDLPGLPAGEFGACAVVVQTHSAAVRGEPFRFQTTADGCQPSAYQLLAVGQKATFTTTPVTTCIVGAERLTACTNGDHGFVLQPSGSWVF
ncbi:MAG: hypothetical protein ABW001_10105 [Mycobacterium sp.]